MDPIRHFANDIPDPQPTPEPRPDNFPDPMPDPPPIPTHDPELPQPGEVVPPIQS